MIASLIETREMNGVDPRAWLSATLTATLTATITAIVKGHSRARSMICSPSTMPSQCDRGTAYDLHRKGGFVRHLECASADGCAVEAGLRGKGGAARSGRGLGDGRTLGATAGG